MVEKTIQIEGQRQVQRNRCASEGSESDSDEDGQHPAPALQRRGWAARTAGGGSERGV